MSMKEVITHKDRKSWFTIQMWLINQAAVGFRVYEITGMQGEEVWYERSNTSPLVEHTMDLQHAQVYCSGDIKWDGCMNLKFDEQEIGMLHFCRNPGKRLHDLMDRLYDMAAELLPNPENDLMAA